MKKILLVEDNETIIMGLKYSLEQENFQVISAKSVAESKEKINQEKIDIVLLDVSLPDGNGFDICKEIKEKQDIPVIFLTAQDEETSVVLGLDLGTDDYIVKPFRTRELISRIKSVLRRYGQKEEKGNIIQYKNIKIALCTITGGPSACISYILQLHDYNYKLCSSSSYFTHKKRGQECCPIRYSSLP